MATTDPIKVRQKLAQIENVPTLPTVVSELFERLRSPRTSAEDINRTIIQDQALTSKILKVANSAFYGFPRTISSVTQAVVILGFETVRNLALTISVFNAFKEDSNNNFNRNAFWQHSLACAVIARSIGEKLQHKDLEDVFIMGLLHDVGKVVLDQYFQEDFRLITDKVISDKILIIDAEKEILGMGHPLVGAAVAEGWNLPLPLVQTIRYHHIPKSAKLPYQEMAAMVHIGDVLARTKKIGDGGDKLVPPLRTESLKILKLAPTDLAVLAQKVDGEMDKMNVFLEMAR